MLNEFAAINQEFPWFFRTLFFILGAVVGSFLNVCIYRIPAGRSIIHPGSHCACGKPIAWYDNIPIFSWLILRGRSRCCGQRFSFRYPAIELLTALLFLASWWMLPPATALIGMVFSSILICATFIDLDHMIIPDRFTIGAAVVGVILSLFVPSLHLSSATYPVIDVMRSGIESIIGLLIGSGIILWIALLAEVILRKEAMGFGDVKFLGCHRRLCRLAGSHLRHFRRCRHRHLCHRHPITRQEPPAEKGRRRGVDRHLRPTDPVRPHARGRGTPLFPPAAPLR